MFKQGNPSRRHILWRWLATILIVAGSIFWLVWFKDPQPIHTLSDTQNLQPPSLEIPDQNIRENLLQGLRIVDNPPQHESLSSLDTTFLPRMERGVDQGMEDPEEIVLGLVFTGERENLAMINSRIYTQGQKLPDGRKLAAVTDKGILLSGHGGEKWISWDAPHAVLLQKRGQDNSRQISVSEENEKETEDPETVQPNLGTLRDEIDKLKVNQ